MKMKGERMAKRSSFGGIVRKRLSDITNSTKVGTLEEKQTQKPVNTEDLINQLLKDKATLMKLIEERNKIIELSGNELLNLRMNYQKLKLQNWNLAQSNSHILAELNLGKEKLKALQHEILCKEALLKVKNLEPQGKVDMDIPNTGIKEGEEVVEKCFHKTSDDAKLSNRSKRRMARSKSMGSSSTTHRQTAEKDKVQNKRRQSARFNSEQREPAENLFEIEDAKFPVTQEDFTTPSCSSVTKVENCDIINQAQAQVLQRSSLGRPLRRAAGKVQSYKEVPLNVKMRR